MRVILSFLFLATLISCGGDSTNSESDGTETGKVMQSEFLDTCQCDVLEIDSLGNHLKEGEKYTGICVDFYPNSEDKYIEKNLLEGRIHGKVTFYGKDGEVLIEEIYEDGEKKRSGEVEVLNCACTELVQEKTNIPQVPYRYLLDEIPYTGTCEEYFPESDQLYVKREYTDGLLDGRSVYYNKDGSTLMIEKYDKGLLVSVIN